MRAFWVGLMIALPILGDSLEKHAAEFKEQLAGKVMPYWYDTAQDHQNGGYLLMDEAKKGRSTPSEKQLVSQSRMIWGFAHAHLKGLSSQDRNYLRGAEQGFRFLQANFIDKENGGYFWTTDLKGSPLNRNKIVYGQSFVIYGLVELHRASKRPEPLEAALALYRTLQKNAHDSTNSGWVEHFSPEWKPILKPGQGA